MSWHHRLRYWLLEREAKRLRRKMNRPYTQSQQQLNPAEERGISRHEVLAGVAIAALFLVTLWIEST